MKNINYKLTEIFEKKLTKSATYKQGITLYILYWYDTLTLFI